MHRHFTMEQNCRVDFGDQIATQRTVAGSWSLPYSLLAVFVTFWTILAIAPISRQDWLLENLLVILSIPLLVLTRHRMRFSNSAYVCLFLFFTVHAVGAHYTYSLVPYGDWWRWTTGQALGDLLGWHRNQYDRAVHLLYGALMLLPAVELFDKYAPPRGAWRWLMPVFFVMSHSVIYELIEWVAALIVAPDLGDAYLGTQGDGWDAQKDMALASAGSIVAMLIYRFRPGRIRNPA